MKSTQQKKGRGKRTIESYIKENRILKIVIGCNIVVLTALVIAVVVLALGSGSSRVSSSKAKITSEKYIADRPELDVQLLDVNPYSRPGVKLNRVQGVVVHYTANPGVGAQNHRDYFQGLAKSKKTKVSSHFIIGLKGEIIQCVPCNEVAYASNNRNWDTISIECCIADETGKFNDATYNSLIHLVTWLMGRYGLSSEDVIRHYDVTGKNCPKYFVEHPSKWEDFLKDLDNYIRWHGVDRVEKN